MGFFIGTDVGGTFTDLWVSADDGQTRVFKSPTTHDVLGGVLDAIALAAEAYGLSFEQFCAKIDRFGHGTTVGLNALLTGNAAKTAVLTTMGFGDTLEIGRLKRQTSGMNELERTDAYLRNRIPPLIPRDLVIEIDERIDVKGNVIKELNEQQARAEIRKLKDRGIEAVAICTLWATHNPSHERWLRDLVLEELPSVFVSCSHEISPGVGEYARMSTTAGNAALGPLAGRYLSSLEAKLQKAGMKVPVLMMTCAGGVLPTAVLNDRPAFALFSGPAGGVMGSRATGAQAGFNNIVTMDIGGTSFDVGVIVSGKPIMRSEISVAGADIRVHSIDVESIGAGGGSIAYVEFGELRVGPRSAGANPGPACYGRGGTRPTATDADLVLGVLDPDNFIGGRMRLDVEAAHRAIDEHVAKPLGMSVIEAAWSIRQILDSKMADLLRRMTIERGYDPRDFTLLANGGAGPSHAWVLGDELGLDSFIVPAAATAESAYGTGNSDLGFTAERPAYVRVSPGTAPSADQLGKVTAALASATDEVCRNLSLAGPRGDIGVERFAAIKFRGQTNYLDVPFDGETFTLDTFRAVTNTFEKQYEALFGRGAAFSNAGYELISVRVVGSGALPPPALATKGEAFEPRGSRPVVFRDAKTPVATAIYRTSFPKDGETTQGPAIIEFPGQSVVVPPGASATADRFGNIHVRLAS
ncbi:hydantoinase/oxoprolinase family protein [Pseudorhodoplanes sinuspersici]|uniref:hydantoinase/oxoprolinase family protein n=1 Tax=Pseudorhodoplanes sinuspersici TaxID=1235591 RepID=UPI000FF66469|nr:hydantoinase/oxoprolinase family protein [Pseudorhodoplanes sinuspersici]RKE67645.1 N-methylhydantoinase A [Pseudorhodoplanes sinuspersici]